MESLNYYTIGGKVIKITTPIGKDVNHYLPQFGKFRIDNPNLVYNAIYDFEIILNDNQIIKEQIFNGEVSEFEFTNMSCIVSCTKNKNIFKISGQTELDNSTVVYYEQNKNEQVGRVFLSGRNIDSTVLSYTLWLSLTLGLISKGIIPIHSSVVIYKEEAILFLGESGTGKSTQKDLWLKNIEGSFCLNDDSPLLSVNNTCVKVWGSPWSGKGKVFLNETYKIRAIVRVVRGNFNKIEKVVSAEAFGAVYPSLPPFLHQFEVEEDMVCEMLSNILMHSQVYKLYCKPERESAFITLNELYDENES